jgi:hypothetical protein
VGVAAAALSEAGGAVATRWVMESVVESTEGSIVGRGVSGSAL